MKIVKRDGSIADFSVKKITTSIEKAFKSQNIDISLSEILCIIKDCRFEDVMTVEQIQNEVETALMKSGYYNVAKAFILYRHEHTATREVADQLKFLAGYCNAKNAASGSKYDANANVEHKNIATLIGELPKKSFIQLNRKLLTDRIKALYGKELADEYIELLTKHFIYKNDETSLANYCASITMYPWLLNGTTGIGGNSSAPTNLKSFCGGFVNMVFIVSSMLSGACATPEFLMYMNYFIGKEYGKDYWKHSDRCADLSKRHRSIEKVITDCFEQIVYSLNQPTGARNFQAVFWNISYYDRYYFDALFGEFRFPDGSKPDWDGLNWLQKKFMKWFNEERTKTVLTFPVETMALLTENNKPKDKEWGDFTAEMYSEGHSFFTYMSDNADSLSSCCFSKDTRVMWRFCGNRNINITTFEEVYNLKDVDRVEVPLEGDWVYAKCVKLPARRMYDVYCNGKKYVMTDNHISLTSRGEVKTSELIIGDELLHYKNGQEVYYPIDKIYLSEYDDYVYCFECVDDSKPYFMLPTGLVTHNCRLRNEIQDNGFSYTLGAGGVSTGSKSVLTINLNRCIQYAMKKYFDYHDFLNHVIDVCHKVQTAYNENLKELQEHGMLPLFDEGYINISRQYLTIGVNGLVEAAEYLGYKISDNPDYKAFVQDVLGMVETHNKKNYDKKRGLMFNCEMIPAENVGVKHAKWDKEDGYFVPRDCYNSYFYVVEDPNTNIIEKFKLHGAPYIEHLTGGSALHMNLDEHLSKKQYAHLLEVAAKEGCNYFTFNIPNTVCNDCGHIDKHHLKKCPKCGSENVDYLTRIIGYLKRVSNFSTERQKEAQKRFYAHSDELSE